MHFPACRFSHIVYKKINLQQEDEGHEMRRKKLLNKKIAVLIPCRDWLHPVLPYWQFLVFQRGWGIHLDDILASMVETQTVHRCIMLLRIKELTQAMVSNEVWMDVNLMKIHFSPVIDKLFNCCQFCCNFVYICDFFATFFISPKHPKSHTKCVAS